MSSSDNNTSLVVVGVAILVAVVGFLIYSMTGPGDHDDFAKCLTEKGVTMYGAYWCSHCANQKQMFGKSFEYVHYVECSLPDGTQTKECADAGIKGYPTWEFPDGKRIEAEVSFQQLSEGSGCPIIPPSTK